MKAKKIELNLKSESPASCPLYIGRDLIGQIQNLIDLKNYSQIVLLSEENVAGCWLRTAMAALPPQTQSFVLAPGEKSKSLKNLELIWDFFKSAELDRGSLVLNLGGGMLCDLGAFAAACYMRGVKFIQMPTSLLAQVDASVGGKTAVNFGGIKNLIGSFTQPQAVIIDTSTLKTLPEREFLSGMAEVIKHGLIADSEYFRKAAAIRLSKDNSELPELISRSVEIKAEIVACDEKEAGKRKLLNFGHTLGHALEAASINTKNEFLHGEAVALGMTGEAFLSFKQGFISEKNLQEIEAVLSLYKLPIRAKFDTQIALDKMRHDKKKHKATLSWTLLKKIGQGCINQNLSDSEVLAALKYLNS